MQDKPDSTTSNRRGHIDDEDDEIRFTKAKRHDIDLPAAEVDIKLAEKLDSILKLSNSRKPRFFTNRPKASTGANQIKPHIDELTPQILELTKNKLVRRNLDKQELAERLAKRYDSLAPELNTDRPTVKLVKVLSATESMKLAEGEAKKQIERELQLGSVSGNLTAHQRGFGAFRFKDGYRRFHRDKDIERENNHEEPDNTREPKKGSAGCVTEDTLDVVGSPDRLTISVDAISQEEEIFQSRETLSAHKEKKTVRFADVEDHSDGVLYLGNRYNDLLGSDSDISDHNQSDEE